MSAIMHPKDHVEEINELIGNCNRLGEMFLDTPDRDKDAGKFLEDAGFWLDKLLGALKGSLPELPDTPETETPDSDWAIVELMGHVKMAGRVTEETKFGTTMGRVDIPQGEVFRTCYFSGSSVYRVTPCTEAEARDVAQYGYIRRASAALPAAGYDPDDEDPFA